MEPRFQLGDEVSYHNPEPPSYKSEQATVVELALNANGRFLFYRLLLASGTFVYPPPQTVHLLGEEDTGCWFCNWRKSYVDLELETGK